MMDASREHALLPCPFCGGEAAIEQTGNNELTLRCVGVQPSGLLGCGPKYVQKAGIRFTLEWLAERMAEKWNRRSPIPEAGNGGDGWLPIESAPKDFQIIAISWQEGYGSFESRWSKPEVYEWDELHSYWANKQRGTYIWPKYQDRYRCKSLGRSPSPPSPSNEGEKQP